MSNRSLQVFMALLAGMFPGIGGHCSPLQAAPPSRARADLYGDPLPAGPLARLGTVRFRPVSWVAAGAVSPDGKTVASLSGYGMLCLWEADRGRLLRRWRAANGGCALAFSPDSKLLASAGGKNELCVWEVATGREVGPRGRTEEIVCPEALAFSPDGKTLAVGHNYGLLLYEPVSGKLLRQYEGSESFTLHVAWSPDGKTLACAGMEPVVHLCDASSGQQRRAIKLPSVKRYTGYPNSLAFSLDGKAVAVGTEDGRLSLFTAETGKCLWERRLTRNSLFSIAFSPDGKALVATDDDALSVHETATGKPLRRWRGHDESIRWVSFSADGNRIFSAGLDGLLRRWEAATGECAEPTAGHIGPVLSLAFAADGKTVVSAGRHGELRLWETATGKPLGCRRAYLDMASSVTFAPGGGLLASTGNASEDPATAEVKEQRRSGLQDQPERTGDLYVWELKGGRLRQLWKGEALRVAFSPDGTRLAGAGRDGQVRLWEAATGKLLRQWDAEGDGVRAISFAPDGRVLASAGRDRNLRLWDTATGTLVAPLHAATTAEDLWVFSVLHSPDGGLLAVQEREGKVALWEAATGTVIHSLLGEHPCFSPDGQLLAATTRNGVLHLWDALTGEQLAEWSGHAGAAIFALSFSPDGSRLASGSEDSTVLIWDVRERLGGARRQAAAAAAAELEDLWMDLGSRDGAHAYRAIARLAAAPDLAVPFLRERLLGGAARPGGRVAKLLEELDSDEFAVREKATRELEKLGSVAEPALRRALDGTPSPEVTRRLKALLARVGKPSWAGDHVQALRAVLALGRAGTKEARRALEKLAEGANRPALARAARGALLCLKKAGGLAP